MTLVCFWVDLVQIVQFCSDVHRLFPQFGLDQDVHVTALVKFVQQKKDGHLTFDHFCKFCGKLRTGSIKIDKKEVSFNCLRHTMRAREGCILHSVLSTQNRVSNHVPAEEKTRKT